MLNTAVGINVQHVPYKGSAPALQDLAAGRLDYVCDAVSSALPQIQSHKIKPIAVLARHRSPVLANIATGVLTWQAAVSRQMAAHEAIKQPQRHEAYESKFQRYHKLCDLLSETWKAGLPS